jgi:hypothetical protein
MTMPPEIRMSLFFNKGMVPLLYINNYYTKVYRYTLV